MELGCGVVVADFASVPALCSCVDGESGCVCVCVREWSWLMLFPPFPWGLTGSHFFSLQPL